VPEKKPIKLALLWHMHQPNYQEPGSNHLVLPWVRLHGTKDYLDMLMLATEQSSVKVTFNLVPSLLDQIDLYVQGGSDPHLDLSRMNASQLSPAQRTRVLETFFCAHPPTMIEPYPRYLQLYKKARSEANSDVLAALFSAEELRDLQVWSNLVWVDPLFRGDPLIARLFEQGRQYHEEQKQELLNWQLEHLKKIIPAYRKALDENRIDLSFTPYYHPILPLLCDTDVAREATPNLELPKHRFQHPEDAAWHIEKSMELFQTLFGRPMVGMWPSEGSISSQVAELARTKGIKWIASDEEVLRCSLEKSGLMVGGDAAHHVYEYTNGLKMFFRDHGLSDRIGFVYSGWDAARSTEDFVNTLHRMRDSLSPDQIEETVVPVILDGENAWEFFPNDGLSFLRRFYRTLAEDKLIEMVGMSDAAEKTPARRLPKLHAGSWINHNFRIWIGHHEDNAAWDLLWEAREALIAYEHDHPDMAEDVRQAAWKQLHIAEGSDWCWWYGDEHRGQNNEQFDVIYRHHLMGVYELLGLDIPIKLHTAIYNRGAALKPVLPDSLVTPTIDGRLTYFYEWAGAGYFDCLRSGGAMHRVDNLVSAIYFAYDHKRLYIRLDFTDRNGIDSLIKPKFQLLVQSTRPTTLNLDAKDCRTGINEPGVVCYLGQILEIGVDRSVIFDAGYGKVSIQISIFDDLDVVEEWPESNEISFEIAPPGDELFWPTYP